MTNFNKFWLEVCLFIGGAIILIIGFKSGTNIVFYKIDGFYFFVGGIILIIYACSSLISKRRDQRKQAKEKKD